MSKLKKSKGFTLIELLVALAIVSTILLAFFKVTDSTTKMNVKNDLDIKALNLAQSEIENLRNQIKNNTLIEEDIEPYKKSIDGKEFNIDLDITKSNVNTKNDNVNTGLYMYTISISVQPVDIYFSEKTTELKDIKILSKNSQ